MTKTLLLHAIPISFCAFSHVKLIYKETFNGVTAQAQPAGWITTANRITVNNTPSAIVPQYTEGKNIRRPNSFLSITIDQFTALLEDKRVRLQWQTSNQKSVSHFEIETSVNGNLFQTLEIIPAKRNELNATEAYEYIHQHPGGAEIIYYRLKLVDEHSFATYSKIIQVKWGRPDFQIHSIYLLPVKDQLTFSWYSNTISPARFSIIDVTGRIHFNQTNTSIKGLNTTNFNIRNLPAGVFFLNIYINQEELKERFVKE